MSQVNTAVEMTDLDDLESLLSSIQEDVVEVKDFVDLEIKEADITDIMDDIESIEADLDEIDSMELESKPAVVIEKASERVVTVAVETPKVKAKSAPRVDSTDLRSLVNAQDSFILDAEIGESESYGVDFEAIKIVKVRDKLANVVQFMSGSRSLSRYTLETVKFLINNPNTTKQGLTNNFLDLGLAIGTASSQSGQMTRLLPTSHIANIIGSTVTLNETSVIVAMVAASMTTEVINELEEA